MKKVKVLEEVMEGLMKGTDEEAWERLRLLRGKVMTNGGGNSNGGGLG